MNRLTVALLVGIALVATARADMYQDASNAVLPLSRTNLGLGTIATQNANALNLTGPVTATGSYNVSAPSFTNPSGGINAGQRIVMTVSSGLSGNPGVNDAIASSIFVDNTSGRTATWAVNLACLNQNPADGGGVGAMHCQETDVVQSQAAVGPTDPIGIGPVTRGLELVASHNTSTHIFNPHNAVWVWSAQDDTTMAFNFAFTASRIKYAGLACAPYDAGAPDTGTYFQQGCVADSSNSAVSYRLTGTHTALLDTTGVTALTYVWQGPAFQIKQNGTFVLAGGTMSGAVVLIGTEGNQLDWSLGGQDWHISMASGGNLYVHDATNTKFPLVLGKNTGKALTIGAQFTVSGLPATSPGGGGGFVCADSVGDFYIKATCP